MELTEDADSSVRDAVGEVLLYLDRDALISKLRGALADPTSVLGGQAGALLAKALGSDALPEIRHFARRGCTGDRVHMATAMGFIDTAEATQHLCRLARDEDEDVSVRAIERLEGRPGGACRQDSHRGFEGLSV
jgi:HEAT repeat protein